MIFATSFTACKKGLSWQMALSLLLEMDELRVERDLISFNASLNAIGSAHQWQRALALLLETSCARNTWKTDVVSFTSVMAACVHVDVVCKLHVDAVGQRNQFWVVVDSVAGT